MTDYCDRLHRAVTAEECGMCWLRLEGDADCITVLSYPSLYPVDEQPTRTPGMMPTGDKIHFRCGYGGRIPFVVGWDACRAKHITADAQKVTNDGNQPS